MSLRFCFLSAALLLLPIGVRAAPAAPSECERLYDLWENGQLPAVSQHYTDAVLRRVQAGIARADTLDTQEDFAQYLPDWALSVQSTLATLIDAELRISVQQKSLLQHSACLRLDLLLLECAMHEVSLASQRQFVRGSIPGIQALQQLLLFLNERYRHLARGALDPLYEDPSVQHRQSFDPPREESAEDEPAAPPLCPYHTDYAPPFSDGFGCDIEILTPRATFAPLRAELEALQIIDRAVTAERDTAQAFLGLQQELDAVFGRDSPLPDPPSSREHRTAFGCGRTDGMCLGNHSVRCTTDDQCTEAGAESCVIPEGVCSDNRIRLCIDDGDCEGAGLCMEDTEGLPSSRELRGPFSMEKDHLRILTEFLDVRTAQELSRSFASDLKLAEEFSPAETVAREERAQEHSNPFLRAIRDSMRALFRVWSRIQGTREAPLFVRTIDPQREVALSLAPLQQSVSRIAVLAREPDGLRAFVLRYASFLRRTCVNRPCNAVLERVLKTAFADECFPYTNGEYLTDTPDDPRWQQCEEAVDRQ